MGQIPNSKEFVNLILSKTQRKTPTIIHRHFSVQKIRHFYIKKLKFFHQFFEIFVNKILKRFPLIDQLHQFYQDLLNLLFNRNNYKISLNKLNNSKIIISKISFNHIKLLKYGNSLYSCKQIKKEGLGKMCNIIKKLNKYLTFLEKIRVQLDKLPKIDPHRKIILLGGTSRGGKSSLMNKLTKTSSEIGLYKQKNNFLSLGHLNYKFTRWQLIDIPSIINYTIDSYNSTEMQIINAYVHLDCIIIYLIDFDEKSEISIQMQIKIFLCLSKLIKKKKKIFVLGKTDLGWEKKICFKKKTFINFLNNFDENKKISLKLSSHDEIGISTIRDESINVFQENKDTRNCLNRKINQFYDKNPLSLTPYYASKYQKIHQKLNKGELKKEMRQIYRTKTEKIISLSLKNFFYDKNFFSIEENNLKKNINFQKEEKSREYEYEKKFAKEKMKSFIKSEIKSNRIKIFNKNLFFWNSGFLN